MNVEKKAIKINACQAPWIIYSNGFYSLNKFSRSTLESLKKRRNSSFNEKMTSQLVTFDQFITHRSGNSRDILKNPDVLTYHSTVPTFRKKFLLQAEIPLVEIYSSEMNALHLFPVSQFIRVDQFVRNEKNQPRVANLDFWGHFRNFWLWIGIILLSLIHYVLCAWICQLLLFCQFRYSPLIL